MILSLNICAQKTHWKKFILCLLIHYLWELISQAQKNKNKNKIIYIYMYIEINNFLNIDTT